MPNNRPQRLVFRPLFLLGLLIAVMSLGVWQSTGEGTKSVAAESPRYIPNRYIVMLREDMNEQLVADLLNLRDDATVNHVYSDVFSGVAGEFSDEVAEGLAWWVHIDESDEYVFPLS